MVVTGSRLHAVRYYFEFDKYIKKMGYQKDLGILVAFSGVVKDSGEEYTEYGINKIKEAELPKKFNSGEYQVLLVAEKYQTGFDEPLLHTMFVDKKLSGVKAVQTLSRLNRTCFGKEDTFVLDFVNSAEDIRAAFAPYYEESTIEQTTDANIVYDLKSKLDEFRVYWDTEIENFAKAFFKPSKNQGNSSLFDGSIDSRTTFVIKNQPRIRIAYGEPTEVYQVHNDIRGIMQFFGLMIGHVTDAMDIRLDIQEQSLKSWLYINEDFSYNLRTQGIIDRIRTKHSQVYENIQLHFENWYDFYNNDKFELIRRMYFLGNTKKDIYAEDLLVLYVRILEGYHLRITDEEKIASNIEKDVNEMIYTDEGRAVFTPIFEKADWKFNSKHAKAVASWIASGFLEKVGLAERIKQLDEQYFSIIAKNAEKIIKLENKNSTLAVEYDEQDIVLKLYRNIVSTRNYYSHYKAKKENVLNFTQMCNTINVLKALIIMIMFSHMGMTKEQIRKIIIWDSELKFETKCLRNEGETPDYI